MKKLFFFLAAGAMGFTACTSEDVVSESVQANAIGFQNVITKESRALTTADLNTFYVYGFYTKTGFEANPVSVFDGVKVTLSGTTSDTGSKWTYSTPRYWVPDATYKFYAYSCDNNSSDLSNNGNAGMSFDDQGNPSVGIDGYICNDSHQHDLVFANTDDGTIVGKQEGNALVPFKFRHILSKINVKFVSGFPAGYDLKISAVKVTNVYGKADYALYSEGESSWTPSEGVTPNTALTLGIAADKNVAKAKDGEVAAVDVLTNDTYVIPHRYLTTNVGISFRVDITNGETTVMSRVFSGDWKPNWVEGTAYTYTIRIDGESASLEKIEFGEMEVGEWEIGTNVPQLSFGAPTNPVAPAN